MTNKKGIKDIKIRDNKEETCNKTIHIGTSHTASIFSKEKEFIEEMKVYGIQLIGLNEMKKEGAGYVFLNGSMFIAAYGLL